MNWIIAKSVTSPSESSKVITKVRAGLRPSQKILIRRIPVNLLLFRVGHFWVEFLHEDESEIDEVMKNSRERGLKEKDLVDDDENPLQSSSKANGFRESYGWYPAGFPFQPMNIFNGKNIISSDGTLNGDHPKRRKKDHNKELTELTPTKDRNAGRKKNNNDHSCRAFDPHQNGHFHVEKINFTTSPYLLPNDTRNEEQIFDEIRQFAEEFDAIQPDGTHEEWSWAGDSYKETNCHTFLFLLLATCNLADPDCIGLKQDRHFIRYKKSLENLPENTTEKNIIRKMLIKKLSNISKKAKSE
ncbi:hypothetical protein A9G45_11570 [Gilliamella sp. HK2]|jgi:hypothetical protein|uniref:hypothetical protein n=1 Tax=unclassified Gilliamella TaxID=2685620 RepID=UPI00080EA7B5|nr:hypothetical protein [Gilliamella apicola]OCG26114.1 hypothetical protein A9G46_05730 [Gilliamella apicola]OCG26208.1 hypothetical protein A9G45_11570 [Gilliamella apicola]